MKHGKIIDRSVIYDSADDYSDVEEIKGGLSCGAGATVSMPNLKKLGGGLFCYDSATVSLPELTEIGWDLYCYEGAKLYAPKLKTKGV